MSRVRVESAVKIQDMSRVQSRITVIVIWVRVELTGYCLSQSWVTDFSKRKRQDLAIICNFTEKEPTYSYIRPHLPPPPPPGQQLFPKLGKMWWIVSQIWLNSDSNELSQSWVKLVNLGFELSRSWVRLANLGFELSRSWVTWIVMSQSRVSPKKWVEHNPDYEYLLCDHIPGHRHPRWRGQKCQKLNFAIFTEWHYVEVRW